MADAGYADDITIPNEAELWRRVSPRHFVNDENLGIVRPSSAAFDDHPNGSPMSVYLAEVLIQMGRGPDTVLVGHNNFALAAITAGLARECGQGVARDPLPEEPPHALVFGQKTKPVSRKFALGSRWVVLPPQPQTS
jgi:hypothetical protein